MMGQNLAIIPARGGSKGIPRKNLAPVGGRPLLSYTVGQALAAGSVDRVVVSTDDAEIADVARADGAEVVRRPPELAGDLASSEGALLHVLDTLATEGYEPDLVVFLQATSPLRQPDDIDRAVELLLREGADSLFSGCPMHGFVWRHGSGSLTPLTYDPTARQMRQEIGTDYVENGSIYVTRRELLRREANRLGGRMAVYPMDPLSIFQIDEPADLGLVEKLMTLAQLSGA